MQLERSVINRLMAARHLIESSGQEITPNSDPLVVAQKLLLAHDAIELALLGICAQLRLEPREKDGRSRQEASFWALAKAALDADGSPELSSKLRLFEDLNRVRVDFKHHGVIADAATHYHLFDESIRTADALCERLLHQSLLTVDHIAAVLLDEVREHFVFARQHIRDALENTANGLAVAFWNMDVPSSLTPGVPVSEEALLLSGRGIDPASFLVMQQLLPRSNFAHDAEWQLRKFGHLANWTRENAQFCLETATTCVVRLQSARVKPRPFDFYEVFEDVLVVESDKPMVVLVEHHLFSFAIDKRQVTEFQRGDRITGKAIGHLSAPGEPGPDHEMELDLANWIEVESPATDRIELPAERLGRMWSLWFKKEDVRITYQSSSRRRATAQRLSERQEDSE